MDFPMAALAGLLTYVRMYAGGDSAHRLRVAGIAFYFGSIPGVRVCVLIGVAVGSGQTSVHAGLKACALFVVAG